MFPLVSDATLLDEASVYGSRVARRALANLRNLRRMAGDHPPKNVLQRINATRRQALEALRLYRAGRRLAQATNALHQTIAAAPNVWSAMQAKA